jgi:hypothetical protein
LGWIDGRNVRIVARWGAGDAASIRKYAKELVASAPDVILATTSPAVAALQQTTRTVPIVFASVVDPVGGGFVDSMGGPGGNTTGFTLFEYGLSGKWLELLRQIAPSVTRAAVLRDATLMTGVGQLAEIQAVASSLARISHTNRRIGSPNQRELLCRNDFTQIRGAPRCRRSVARSHLILEPWKVAVWKRHSMPGWSPPTQERCCWARPIERSE